MHARWGMVSMNLEHLLEQYQQTPLLLQLVNRLSFADKQHIYLKNAQGIILTTIYSKSDLTDVSNEIIEQAIAQYEEENTIPDQ